MYILWVNAQVLTEVQVVKRWGMIAVLVLTWLILYYTLAFFTSLIMAPWDTALTRPELDTWQRSLNDFFETGGGQIVALAFMLASMGVVLPSLRRRPSLAIQYRSEERRVGKHSTSAWTSKNITYN